MTSRLSSKLFFMSSLLFKFHHLCISNSNEFLLLGFQFSHAGSLPFSPFFLLIFLSWPATLFRFSSSFAKSRAVRSALASLIFFSNSINQSCCCLSRFNLFLVIASFWFYLSYFLCLFKCFLVYTFLFGKLFHLFLLYFLMYQSISS